MSERIAVALLATSVVVLVALTLFVPGRPQENIRTLLPLPPPILWVAGVLLLTRLAWARGDRSPIGAGILYGVAFVLPAADIVQSGDIVWGFQAFTYGPFVVPVAWLANVAFVAGIELKRRERRSAAIWSCLVACFLALTIPLSMDPNIRVSFGFVTWAAAPAILAVAMLRERRPAISIARDGTS